MIQESEVAWEQYNNIMNALREAIAKYAYLIIPTKYSTLGFGSKCFSSVHEDNSTIIGLIHDEEGIQIQVMIENDEINEFHLQDPLFEFIDIVNILKILENYELDSKA